MLDYSRVQNYYIACGYTDMRKQIDGLAALIKLEYNLELDEESLFSLRRHRHHCEEVCGRATVVPSGADVETAGG